MKKEYVTYAIIGGCVLVALYLIDSQTSNKNGTGPGNLSGGLGQGTQDALDFAGLGLFAILVGAAALL
jgi:hypothetical protein